MLSSPSFVEEDWDENLRYDKSNEAYCYGNSYNQRFHHILLQIDVENLSTWKHMKTKDHHILAAWNLENKHFFFFLTETKTSSKKGKGNLTVILSSIVIYEDEDRYNLQTLKCICTSYAIMQTLFIFNSIQVNDLVWNKWKRSRPRRKIIECDNHKKMENV